MNVNDILVQSNCPFGTYGDDMFIIRTIDWDEEILVVEAVGSKQAVITRLGNVIDINGEDYILLKDNLPNARWYEIRREEFLLIQKMLGYSAAILFFGIFWIGVLGYTSDILGFVIVGFIFLCIALFLSRNYVRQYLH